MIIFDFCVIISLLWGDSVILFINNKLYEFSESNLNDMYLDEGKEGVIYQYKGYVLKIYHPRIRKARLSENDVLKLMKIHTSRFLLPLGLIYNDKKKFCGYYAKKVMTSSLDYIFNIRLSYLFDELKAFEEEIELLTNKQIEINDFIGINVLYDDHFYMCDPGSFLFNSFCSLELLRKMNYKKLNQFFIEDIIGKGCSTRKLNNIYRCFDDISVPLSEQIANIGNPNETIRQFVKRIS